MSHIDPLLVFIVDDDVEFGTKLFDNLKNNASLDVEFFSEAESCLQQLNKSPDAVILDCHLDGTDKSVSNGMVILEKIKDYDPLIHVIMITALNHYGIAAQAISKGAEQCVIKDDDAFKNISMILEAINNERK
jgi:DNA-binding NtrC family response regulator